MMSVLIVVHAQAYIGIFHLKEYINIPEVKQHIICVTWPQNSEATHFLNDKHHTIHFTVSLLLCNVNINFIYDFEDFVIFFFLNGNPQKWMNIHKKDSLQEKKKHTPAYPFHDGMPSMNRIVFCSWIMKIPYNATLLFTFFYSS